MAVRNLLIVLALLSLLAPARADWSVSSSEIEKSPTAGIEHRTVVLTGTGSGDQATLDLALFATKSATLRVIDDPSGAQDLAGIARRNHGIAGVNGGYFDPENAPVGLLVSDGKLIAPFRKARLLSGVLVVTKGRVELLRSTEYSTRKSPLTALQCGPFLAENGQVVAGLNTTRSARRTFVFTGGGDRAAVGFCSSVTLAELAEILVAPHVIPDLKVQRAMNLDGGSSSAFWFAGEGGPFSIQEQKTVRDFVVVVPK